LGKGLIKSGGTDGQYQVEIKYNTVRYDDIIEYFTSQLVKIQAELSEILLTKGADSTEYKTMLLRKTAMEKRKQYLEENTPKDYTVSAWCADLTEDLSGTVATIEVPGEVNNVQIAPGFDNGASYNASTYGQLMPIISQTPEGLFYNLAMLPGWGKWKPLYRYGTITGKPTTDTANVTLDETKSTQPSGVSGNYPKIDLNQTSTLSNVSIDYMDCDGKPFENGDEVLVKFEGQDWANPKIIGFKDHPKDCMGEIIVIVNYDESFNYWVLCWDPELDDFAALEKPGGGPVTYPAPIADVGATISGMGKVSQVLFGITEINPDIEFIFPGPGSGTQTFDKYDWNGDYVTFTNEQDRTQTFNIYGVQCNVSNPKYVETYDYHTNSMDYMGPSVQVITLTSGQEFGIIAQGDYVRDSYIYERSLCFQNFQTIISYCKLEETVDLTTTRLIHSPLGEFTTGSGFQGYSCTSSTSSVTTCTSNGEFNEQYYTSDIDLLVDGVWSDHTIVELFGAFVETSTRELTCPSTSSGTGASYKWELQASFKWFEDTGSTEGYNIFDMEISNDFQDAVIDLFDTAPYYLQIEIRK